jgi:hypothetical protein
MIGRRFKLRTVRYGAAIVLFLLGPGAFPAHVLAMGWDNAGEMVADRYTHTATLLPDGKVLVAGGSTGINENPFYSSAELYDPATGTWSATGSMGTARQAHTATLLPNGTILIAGGATDITDTGSLSSSETYDPSTGTWTATGSMGTTRSWHTATLLPNGKVLIAGGSGNTGVLSSAELYDPDTGLWSATGSMGTARHFPFATLLPSGKVLVAGGGTTVEGSVTLSSSETYDPDTGLWSATGSMGTARQGATLTLLPDGKVLTAGGWGGAASLSLSSAELYDPDSGLWTPTGSMGAVRYRTSATPLGNVDSAELYDPSTETWSATVSMSTARATHTATQLPDNKVLVAGGTGGSGIQVSAELFDPSPTVISTDPSNGATGISINTPITVTFSQPMDAATIVPAAFVLTGGGNSVTCTASYGNGKATFTPTSALANNTTYTATLSTTVNDAAGIPMAGDYIWSFTTESAKPGWEYKNGLDFVFSCASVSPNMKGYPIGGVANLLILFLPAIVLLFRMFRTDEGRRGRRERPSRAFRRGTASEGTSFRESARRAGCRWRG